MFDLADFLAQAGANVDTGKREQIEYISIDLIVPDPNNFYELSNLEDLASNIALCGLQQPLRVRTMEGDESKVVIISGHRRHAALRLLIEQDGREDLRDVPCIVEAQAENPKLTQLKLIYANASTRVLSSADQARQAEQVEQLLYELKEDGMEFPGRMRDYVAQACQVSTGKIARLKLIRSSLIPQFMRLWEAGKFPDNTAELLAKETPRYQKEIFLAQNGTFRCTTDWVKGLLREMHNAEDICKKLYCEKTYITGCDHVHVRLTHAAGLSMYSGMSCRGCCFTCYNLQSCKYSCEHAADEKKKRRDAERKANAESEARAEEAMLPPRDLIQTAYSRVAQLRKDNGIEVQDFLRASNGYIFAGDQNRLAKLESGDKATGNDRMPGGIWPREALQLIRTAELLGCTVDYLLGRPEQPKTEPAADGWRTGEPTAPGWYLCRFRLAPKPDPMYAEFWWGGKKWAKETGMEEITHWLPAVEEE